MTSRFNLESRNVTETLSEIIQEKYKVIYSFTYEEGKKTRVITFNLSNLDGSKGVQVSGSYLPSIEQLDFKVIKPIEDLGEVIDFINASCVEIVNDFEKVNE